MRARGKYEDIKICVMKEAHDHAQLQRKLAELTKEWSDITFIKKAMLETQRSMSVVTAAWGEDSSMDLLVAETGKPKPGAPAIAYTAEQNAAYEKRMAARVAQRALEKKLAEAKRKAEAAIPEIVSKPKKPKKAA